MGVDSLEKICSTCKQNKPLSDFSFDKKSKDGYKYSCKSCKNLQEKKRLSDPLKREKENKRSREWRSINPEKAKQTVKKYRNSNREKYKAYQKEYVKNKRNKQETYKLKDNVSRAVRYALKSYSKINKTLSTFEALGYDVEALKKHLESHFESWMNWENYGKYEKGRRTWQIDHIIPVSTFSYSSMEDEQFKKCWSLDNLRPLEAIENIRKGDRLV